MNQYLEYAKNKIAIAKLNARQKDLEAFLVDDLKDTDGGFRTKYGLISRVVNKVWKFSKEYAKLEAEVEAKKAPLLKRLANLNEKLTIAMKVEQTTNKAKVVEEKAHLRFAPTK